MQAIGGYFGLADYEVGIFPHSNGVLLNTGRNALEFILRSLGAIKRVYLPYYSCAVVLEPLNKLKIPWSFYHIDTHFEMCGGIQLKDGEYLIVNNYFGIKDAYINCLSKQNGSHLIVDCAQAFFYHPKPNIMSFYSPRKFVGVADGGVAYLYNKEGITISEVEDTAHHDAHLYIRKNSGAEAGFQFYQDNEKKLDNQPIRRLSETTEDILCHIDYDKVVSRRRENYAYMHNALGQKNLLDLPDMESFAAPMVYPFLTEDTTLRMRLIDNKVFVATYWPNLKDWTYPGMLEYDLADRLIPLPIDHRYSFQDMDRVLSLIA